MITMKIKDLFFDRVAVLEAVGKARAKVLSKAGAFIRRTAKGLIRKRRMISEPGQPPSSHTGLLKDKIFFGYDRDAESVVIGPVGFKNSDAPHALEHGGTSRIRVKRGGRIVTRTVKIKARPFMGPALEKERPKLPELWANSVKSG